jgi:ClpP class serine protease
MYWLISHELASEMRMAIAAGFLPTAEQRAEHERRELQAAAPIPRGMSVAGDTAEIRIEGVLTPKPDLFSLFFGGGNTTYRDIQAGLASAQTDPAIKRVVLSIASPGGTVDGLFETLAAIEALKASGKPISVKASSAQSAAYAIAAVAGKIRAETPASMFGSLGVATSLFVDDSVIDIANTESPNKRPDASTPEGQDVIRQELDALFEIFADAIARGRGVTLEAVKADFGRGSSFTAGDAAKRGMIDAAPKLRVVRAEDPTVPVAKGGDTATTNTNQNPPAVHGGARKANAMTKQEFQTQNPELYAAIASEERAAGRKEGETAERDRVTAHLTLGESSGDLKTAHAAIVDGSQMTTTMQAKYMAAGMNRSAVQARQAESDAAGAAANGATPPAAQSPAAATNLVDLFAADLPKKTG